MKNPCRVAGRRHPHVDAVAFGATLAATFGAQVSIVTVSATADEYINDHLDPRWVARRGDEATNLVEDLAGAISSHHGITAQTIVHITTAPPAPGCPEIAEEVSADLVVVGSGPGGSLGRFTRWAAPPTSCCITSPTRWCSCPSGCARHAQPRLRRVMVAFAQGAEGSRALAMGADLARAGGLPMDVVTILVPAGVRLRLGRRCRG